MQPRIPFNFFAGTCSTWCPPESLVLFCQATFQMTGHQHVLGHGVVTPWVQDFALLLVELHEVPVSPFLQPVKVPLGNCSSTRQIKQVRIGSSSKLKTSFLLCF